MISTLLTTGAIVGAAVGSFHAFGVYVARMQSPGGPPSLGRRRLVAAYSAAWTLALWTAFGSYVLALWLLSLPLWVGRKTVEAS